MGRIDKRRQEMALILARAVEPRAAAQACAREVEHRERELGQLLATEDRRQAALRHFGAEIVALFWAPIGDEIPRGGERIAIVEEASPERRQRADAAPRAPIGTA